MMGDAQTHATDHASCADAHLVGGPVTAGPDVGTPIPLGKGFGGATLVDARLRRSPVADANAKAAFSDVVNQYLNRRLPWGTPWWPYAVALGVANVARQLVKPDDLSTAADATIFVLMVVAVVAVVTFGHLALWPQAKVPGDGDEVSGNLPAPSARLVRR
jgi:hypothetical protein